MFRKLFLVFLQFRPVQLPVGQAAVQIPTGLQMATGILVMLHYRQTEP